MPPANTAEHRRLEASRERRADWKHWGPYLSERAWGTVREDYSPDGGAWDYFPHDHARSRAYRWNEDGLGGFCNRFQNLCLSVALWNEQDPILKERLFGVTGPQGNHGEDVKEYYYYLDGVPTHAYMRMLYKYPQVAFPYDRLVAASRSRSRHEREWELIDELAEAFQTGRYFDVTIEYAKGGEEDLLCRITAVNRGPDPAPLHVLPQIWFRNVWSWGKIARKPELQSQGPGAMRVWHKHLGERWWYAADARGPLHLLFTENDTNQSRLFGLPNEQPYVKDAFHEAVCRGRSDAVSPHGAGTKGAGHARAIVAPGESFVVWSRFSDAPLDTPFADAERIVSERQHEADEFYAAIQAPQLCADDRLVQRQAFAGLLWNKQFYHYSVQLWLEGDFNAPPPPASRAQVRNGGWKHLYNLDVISMPDKWEYPWYAAWDLAFHMLPTAMIDPEWAKRQMLLFLREWYMHPNGQLPAYEWNFSDVNPPVHAWAVWRVYKISRKATGEADVAFLEECFLKLMLNFTWWVNRIDTRGHNVFQGGFLGLDNIGLFDRSKPLPGGAILEQADGTAWMGMYCLNMLAMALELARTKPAYESVATKFFEHFMYIAQAINHGIDGCGLWDDHDGFYYDRMILPDGHSVPMRIRSFVGLIPLFAVETLEPALLEQLPRFRRRMEWFIQYRPQLTANVASLTEPGDGGRRLLSLVTRPMLERILPRMFDPSQFLADYGLRSMSRAHQPEPFTFEVDGATHHVSYEPGESSSGMFGGNSNWRGPIWFPVNFLMIESLQKFHHYYGDSLRCEMPRYSEEMVTLDAAAGELSRRLCGLFRKNRDTGRRPVFGSHDLFQFHPAWRDHIPFYEYFHGESGEGLGASHQTGWTALVAKLLQQQAGHFDE